MADTAPTTQPAAPIGGATSQNTSTANPSAPGQTSTAANSIPEAPSANRGLPYYEKLRRDLRDALQKKRLMDKSMSQLEDQIFRFEQSYLEETTAGNIIKGFDNYIKGSGTTAGLSASGIALPAGAGTARRKAQVTDSDRVFSRSSASFMRDSPAPSSAQTTPSHAPTPTSAYNGSSGRLNTDGGPSSAAASVKGGASKNKKKAGVANGNGNKEKDNEDAEDGEKPPAKRLKISYGRD
ncbi:chromatin modification-related protein EAF6/MEAF6 [Aspergillus clavatus NRRL 1]|uniref:Chromatin modification-related protein EAF6 n=1 Tax=Aspergillus clavatus (strain ATCC 1007 / CBS 513.65 / DSM 816 / NCTC 3887 / NRRL 1 / QM 1276 / 107) TaxID=344612 RepID=A1CJT8_ASPCL|nr:uncharacterized protein ACLA_036150 [Aspergillus clavatus NRRL 1]EAW09412.1 conserved hypothetical protein [Aspergillus clavatus NRRL 1]